MWNAVTYFLTFSLGAITGVTIMCLLQAGKQADKDFSEIERGADE